MPLAHCYADANEKFAILVVPAPLGFSPLPSFTIAMIRGPFTIDELDSFMGAWSFRPAAELDSSSSMDGLEIPAAESHFGPCVTVETRGATIGGAMGHVRVEYMQKFFKRQLLDCYWYRIAAHCFHQMLREIKCRENQHAFKSERLHQPGGGVADNL